MGILCLVLVIATPIALTQGVFGDEPRPLVIPPPPPRLLVAPAPLSTPVSQLLPAAQQARITSITPIPGTGIQAVTFDSEQALQQAVAVLTNNGAASIRYCLRDFRLSVDRHIGHITDAVAVADEVWAGHDSEWQDHLRRRLLGEAQGAAHRSAQQQPAVQRSLQQQQEEAIQQPATIAGVGIAAAAPDSAARHEGLEPLTAQLLQQRVQLLQARMQRRRERHQNLHLELPLPNGQLQQVVPSTRRWQEPPISATEHAFRGQQQQQPHTEQAGNFMGTPDLLNRLLGAVQPPIPNSSGSLGGGGSGAVRRRLHRATAKQQQQGEMGDGRGWPRVLLARRKGSNSNATYQAGYAAPLPQQPLQSYLGPSGINAAAAWEQLQGFADVVVAVVDGGVEVTHPAVGRNMWANLGEVGAKGVDDDANGYPDDTYGWNFGGHCSDAVCSSCIADGDPTDSLSGGTLAAAVAAGAVSGAIGTAGVAPSASIMPLKVSDCQTGAVWASHVLHAYSYAAANGAHIVLSPSTADAANGCQANETYPSCVAARSAAFEDAVAPLSLAGVLLVAPLASGQGSSGGGGAGQLPCALRAQHGNILCVSDAGVATGPGSGMGSMGSNGSSGSTAGPDFVVASSQVYAGYLGGGYAEASGPAVAAAIAAGAAALLQGALGTQHGGDAEGLGAMAQQALLSSWQAEGGRLDVAKALSNALAGTALQLLPSGPPLVLPTAAAPGLQLVWYLNSGEADPADMPSLLHTGLRGPPPFGGWQYTGEGALASLSGYLEAAQAGRHTLQVVTPDPFLLALEGKWLLMERSSSSPTTWSAPLELAAVGNYSLALYVFNPTADLDLLWQPPGAQALQRPHDALWSFGFAQTAAQQLLERSSLGAWRQAGGGTTPQAGSPALLALAAPVQAAGPLPITLPPESAVAAAAWSAVVTSLSFASPGGLAAALFGAAGASSLGAAHGRLMGWLEVDRLAAALPAEVAALAAGGSSGGAASVRFRATCDGCSVSLDGMAVVGALHNDAVESPCVALPLGAPGSAVELVITFATSRLEASSLVLEYGFCSGSGVLIDGASGVWRPLEQLLGSRGSVLDAGAAASAAYTPGMLCSARSAAAVSGGAVAATATSFLPLASGQQRAFRLNASQLLPPPPQAQPQQQPEGSTYPTPAAPVPLTITCWTYWAGIMGPNATVGAMPMCVGSATAYLGAHTVLDSSREQCGPPPPQQGQPPQFFGGAGGGRLLVLEWVGVTSESELWVAEGWDAQGVGVPWVMHSDDARVPAVQAAAAAAVTQLDYA